MNQLLSTYLQNCITLLLLPVKELEEHLWFPIYIQGQKKWKEAGKWHCGSQPKVSPMKLPIRGLSIHLGSGCLGKRAVMLRIDIVK